MLARKYNLQMSYKIAQIRSSTECRVSFYVPFLWHFLPWKGKLIPPNQSLSKGNSDLLHYSFYLDMKNLGIWSFYSLKAPLLSAFTCALISSIPCGLFSFRIADLSSWQTWHHLGVLLLPLLLLMVHLVGFNHLEILQPFHPLFCKMSCLWSLT